MNERDLKLLLEANAVKSLNIIGQGCRFHVEVKTQGPCKVVMTGRGDIKQWSSLDACAKWLRKNGIGQAHIQIDQWQPEQKALSL